MLKGTCKKISLCLLIVITVVFFLLMALPKRPLFLYNMQLLLIAASFFFQWFYYVKIRFNILMVIWIPITLLFIMGRPLVSIFIGEDWVRYGAKVTIEYLIILFFSLLGIHLGEYLYVKGNVKEILAKLIESLKNKNLRVFKKSSKCKKKSSIVEIYNPNVKKLDEKRLFTFVVEWGYYICFICYIITKVMEFISMQGKTYLEFYLDRDINLPWLITFLANLSLFFMCIYLSFLKSKIKVIVVTGLYVMTTVPTLIIGQRNPFILSILFGFCVIYYKNKKYWKIQINKKVLGVAFGCLMLLLILGMSYISSSRNNMESENKTVVDSVLSLVYDQGNTYEMISQGILHKNELRVAVNNNYTFAAIIDYFKYGQIGNWLFKTTDIPGGNNEMRAYMSNDMAHKLSYIVLGENYLKGAGLGSSYIVETYVDFSVVGVLLINCIYTILMCKIDEQIGRNWIIDTIYIYIFMRLFFVGRDSAISTISGLVTIHFVFVLFVIIVGYYIMTLYANRKKGAVNEKK